MAIGKGYLTMNLQFEHILRICIIFHYGGKHVNVDLIYLYLLLLHSICIIYLPNIHYHHHHRQLISRPTAEHWSFCL